MNNKYYVYEHGDNLYIGCGIKHRITESNPKRRSKEHSVWMKQQEKLKIKYWKILKVFNSNQQNLALDYEKQLIINNKPKFNKLHTGVYSEMRKGKGNPMYGISGKLSPTYGLKTWLGKTHTEESKKKISDGQFKKYYIYKNIKYYKRQLLKFLSKCGTKPNNRKFNKLLKQGEIVKC